VRLALIRLVVVLLEKDPGVPVHLTNDVLRWTKQRKEALSVHRLTEPIEMIQT